ncbi:hypothetical protein [Staphylococcus petrasii]|uniref:hypothetical protein n=1 Tax=Staphylococcus petrasii TaxID=1276936 RepID=UPI001F5947DA|nr:hypothetical protein [Staphylococcus petrasii]MCI2775093.1 hypothetical protein [Staphylococcus petrasii]
MDIARIKMNEIIRIINTNKDLNNDILQQLALINAKIHDFNYETLIRIKNELNNKLKEFHYFEKDLFPDIYKHITYTQNEIIDYSKIKFDDLLPIENKVDYYNHKYSTYE